MGFIDSGKAISYFFIQLQVMFDFFWKLDLYIHYLMFATLLAFLFIPIRKIFHRSIFDRVQSERPGLLLSESNMNFAYSIMLPMAKHCIKLGISPNQLTWSSLFFAIVATICVANGLFALACLFLLISAYCDLMDGRVAREIGVSSARGEILDSAVDRYVEGIFLFGLALYYQHHALIFSAVIFSIFGSFMISYSSAKASLLKVNLSSGLMKRAERLAALMLSCELSAISLHYFEAPEPGAISAYPMVVAIIILAALTNISAILRLRQIAIKAGS